MFLVLPLALMPGFASHAQQTRSAPASAPQDMPAWLRRGLPGAGHAALESLAGTWHARMSVHATLGRSASDPPIVSDELTTRREWVGGGRYLEDTTEGRLEGTPYWRRGWLGYSNMDRRYEWVTIDIFNATMMFYLGKPGAGLKQPITMTGVFTDQGVSGERGVGKRVPMRTVIRIESTDRHVFELYFTPPGSAEVLATRTVYTRAGQ
jgi:hypothetical protein